jgi:Rad3-related DNA helicase
VVRLPYEPRPGQLNLAEAAAKNARRGGHLLVEAPTGIGKTVAALAAALEACRADGRRLIYATRTNSQQTQVLREHLALQKAARLAMAPASTAPVGATSPALDGAAAALHQPAARDGGAAARNAMASDARNPTSAAGPNAAASAHDDASDAVSAPRASSGVGKAPDGSGEEAEPPLVVPFMGRRQYCPLLRQDTRYGEANAEELSRLCRDAKQKARQAVATGRDVAGACPFYARLLEDTDKPVEAVLRAGVADTAELAAKVEAAGSCPYEALKLLLPRADAVVLPLVFLLDDRLRRALFEWLGTGPDGCHLILDEAHHLPDAAREHHSPRLSLQALKRAQKEADDYKDPVLVGRTLTSSVLDALVRTLYGLVDEFIAPPATAVLMATNREDGAGRPGTRWAPQRMPSPPRSPAARPAPGASEPRMAGTRDKGEAAEAEATHAEAPAAGQDPDLERDGLLPAGAFEERLMHELRLPSTALSRIAMELEQWGEVIREDRRNKGRLPRSYLGSVGAFLNFWLLERDAPYVHLVTAGRQPTIEAYLLEPGAVLGWLGEFASTLHMSGTLRPFEDHQALCGLPERTRRLHLQSPFDASHLRVVGVEGMDRRYATLRDDPDAAHRQQEFARALLARWRGRMGLFFPSHAMLADYLETGLLHDVAAKTYVEAPGMENAELVRMVEAFCKDPGKRVLLLGVLGGRLTEGIDYPGDAMEHLIVFGIPYPRPSARNAALIQHFDARHGRGWDLAVHHPTGRTLRQTIGRLIRGPEDRGTAVILDERVVRFRSVLPALAMVAQPEEVDLAPMPSDEGFRCALSMRGPTG